MRVLGWLLTLTSGTPFLLPAQTTWPTAVDIGAGPTTGWGGERAERSGVAVSLAITKRHEGASTMAFGAGYSRIGGDGDKCVFADGDPTKCLSDFPSTYHASLLFGTSHRKGVSSFRALVGPAIFVGESAPGFGPQAQIDVALGKGRVAAIGGYRASAIFRGAGATEGLGLAIFGIRFQ